MRVLNLRVESVGEVTARTTASEAELSAVVLADIDEARPQTVAGAWARRVRGNATRGVRRNVWPRQDVLPGRTTPDS